MNENLIKTIVLKNGLTLEIYDQCPVGCCEKKQVNPLLFVTMRQKAPAPMGFEALAGIEAAENRT